MHRPYRPLILLKCSLESPAPLDNVSLKASDQSHVVRRIDEDPEVKQIEHPRLGKDQNALNDHDRLRFDYLDPVVSRVGDKIVKRHLDLLPLFEPLDMVDQHIAVDRIRMVKIGL